MTAGKVIYQLLNVTVMLSRQNVYHSRTAQTGAKPLRVDFGYLSNKVLNGMVTVVERNIRINDVVW